LYLLYGYERIFKKAWMQSIEQCDVSILFVGETVGDFVSNVGFFVGEVVENKVGCPVDGDVGFRVVGEIVGARVHWASNAAEHAKTSPLWQIVHRLQVINVLPPFLPLLKCIRKMNTTCKVDTR
jgi:hypothetical protein